MRTNADRMADWHREILRPRLRSCAARARRGLARGWRRGRAAVVDIGLADFDRPLAGRASADTRSRADPAQAARARRRHCPCCCGCSRSSACLWANVPWSERFWGLEGFHKLLVIPLLLAQFRRSERGIYVVYGFFFSCTAMLFASWGLMALWKLWSGLRSGKNSRAAGEGLHRAEHGVSDLRCRAARVRGERWHAQRRLAVGAVLLALIFLGEHFLHRARAHGACDPSAAAGHLRLPLFRLERSARGAVLPRP